MTIGFATGQTNGLPLLVTAVTEGTRQLLHIFPAGLDTPNVVELFAWNLGNQGYTLHVVIEDSGATVMRTMSIGVPVGGGLFKILGVDSSEDVQLIQNGASTIKVWADTASVLAVSASVEDQVVAVETLTYGSGQNNGLPLLITAVTQGARQLLHTFPIGEEDVPQLAELFAWNLTQIGQTLHVDIEDSGATVLHELTLGIPVAGGLFEVFGVDSDEYVYLCQNGASTIKVWAENASALAISARITEQEVSHAGPANVDLLTAATYGVLAGSTVTNTGATTINGDLGLDPGSSVTGAPVVTGATNINNPAAIQAKADLVTAYNDAAGRTGAITVSGDIGGTTVIPGVYNSTSTLGITGTLILDAQGDPNATWIFQIGSALTTAVSSVVSLINGAQAKNVIWQIGSSATLGVTSTFEGSILALTSITANTGAVINGRLLARNGAVTLDTNTVTVPA